MLTPVNVSYVMFVLYISVLYISITLASLPVYVLVPIFPVLMQSVSITLRCNPEVRRLRGDKFVAGMRYRSVHFKEKI